MTNLTLENTFNNAKIINETHIDNDQLLNDYYEQSLESPIDILIDRSENIS